MKGLIGSVVLVSAVHCTVGKPATGITSFLSNAADTIRNAVSVKPAVNGKPLGDGLLGAAQNVAGAAQDVADGATEVAKLAVNRVTRRSKVLPSTELSVSEQSVRDNVIKRLGGATQASSRSQVLERVFKDVSALTPGRANSVLANAIGSLETPQAAQILGDIARMGPSDTFDLGTLVVLVMGQAGDALATPAALTELIQPVVTELSSFELSEFVSTVFSTVTPPVFGQVVDSMSTALPTATTLPAITELLTSLTPTELPAVLTPLSSTLSLEDLGTAVASALEDVLGATTDGGEQLTEFMSALVEAFPSTPTFGPLGAVLAASVPTLEADDLTQVLKQLESLMEATEFESLIATTLQNLPMPLENVPKVLTSLNQLTPTGYISPQITEIVEKLIPRVSIDASLEKEAEGVAPTPQFAAQKIVKLMAPKATAPQSQGFVDALLGNAQVAAGAGIQDLVEQFGEQVGSTQGELASLFPTLLVAPAELELSALYRQLVEQFEDVDVVNALSDSLGSLDAPAVQLPPIVATILSRKIAATPLANLISAMRVALSAEDVANILSSSASQAQDLVGVDGSVANLLDATEALGEDGRDLFVQLVTRLVDTADVEGAIQTLRPFTLKAKPKPMKRLIASSVALIPTLALPDPLAPFAVILGLTQGLDLGLDVEGMVTEFVDTIGAVPALAINVEAFSTIVTLFLAKVTKPLNGLMLFSPLLTRVSDGEISNVLPQIVESIAETRENVFDLVGGLLTERMTGLLPGKPLIVENLMAQVLAVLPAAEMPFAAGTLLNFLSTKKAISGENAIDIDAVTDAVIGRVRDANDSGQAVLTQFLSAVEAAETQEVLGALVALAVRTPGKKKKLSLLGMLTRLGALATANNTMGGLDVLDLLEPVIVGAQPDVLNEFITGENGEEFLRQLASSSGRLAEASALILERAQTAESSVDAALAAFVGALPLDTAQNIITDITDAAENTSGDLADRLTNVYSDATMRLGEAIDDRLALISKLAIGSSRPNQVFGGAFDGILGSDSTEAGTVTALVEQFQGVIPDADFPVEIAEQVERSLRETAGVEKGQVITELLETLESMPNTLPTFLTGFGAVGPFGPLFAPLVAGGQLDIVENLLGSALPTVGDDTGLAMLTSLQDLIAPALFLKTLKKPVKSLLKPRSMITLATLLPGVITPTETVGLLQPILAEANTEALGELFAGAPSDLTALLIPSFPSLAELVDDVDSARNSIDAKRIALLEAALARGAAADVLQNIGGDVVESLGDDVELIRSFFSRLISASNINNEDVFISLVPGLLEALKPGQVGDVLTPVIANLRDFDLNEVVEGLNLPDADVVALLASVVMAPKAIKKLPVAVFGAFFARLLELDPTQGLTILGDMLPSADFSDNAIVGALLGETLEGLTLPTATQVLQLLPKKFKIAKLTALVAPMFGAVSNMEELIRPATQAFSGLADDPLASIMSQALANVGADAIPSALNDIATTLGSEQRMIDLLGNGLLPPNLLNIDLPGVMTDLVAFRFPPALNVAIIAELLDTVQGAAGGATGGAASAVQKAMESVVAFDLGDLYDNFAEEIVRSVVGSQGQVGADLFGRMTTAFPFIGADVLGTRLGPGLSTLSEQEATGAFGNILGGAFSPADAISFAGGVTSSLRGNKVSPQALFAVMSRTLSGLDEARLSDFFKMLPSGSGLKGTLLPSVLGVGTLPTVEGEAAPIQIKAEQVKYIVGTLDKADIKNLARSVVEIDGLKLKPKLKTKMLAAVIPALLPTGDMQGFFASIFNEMGSLTPSFTVLEDIIETLRDAEPAESFVTAMQAAVEAFTTRFATDETLPEALRRIFDGAPQELRTFISQLPTPAQ